MNKHNNDSRFDFDFVIVGSGFGGSVSACRLTEKGYSVAVMEQGKRWNKEDFPETNMNPRKYLWRPSLGMQGFFNIRFFRHMLVVCGNAVGGGSITYGNTLLVPPDSVWQEGSWAAAQDWNKVMPAHFAAAQKMLGVVDNQIMGDADLVLKQMAENAGVGHTFKPTRVATFFDPKGGPGGEVGEPAGDAGPRGEGIGFRGDIYTHESAGSCAGHTESKNLGFRIRNDDSKDGAENGDGSFGADDFRHGG